MSIQAMAWVIDNSKATGSDYAVLLMLANHYNHETGQCNPGYRRIAAEARVSRGTVGNAVARLVKLGELGVILEGLGKRTTRYHFPWLSTDGSSVQPLDARDSLASNSEGLASNPPPLSVQPGMDESLKQNLNRVDAPADAGVDAPDPTHSVATIRAADDQARAQAVPMPPSLREHFRTKSKSGNE